MSQKRAEKLQRRAKRQAKKIKKARQPKVIQPQAATVPKYVGLRELLAAEPHNYPPDMRYGDLIRAFAEKSAQQPGNQDFSTWDVLLDFPYRYPQEWDSYPPTVQEVRALAQSERLRCEEMIPHEWAHCEPKDDDPEEVRARMEALYHLYYVELDTPLPVGERRAPGNFSQPAR
jgi:hypothetical protein